MVIWLRWYFLVVVSSILTVAEFFGASALFCIEILENHFLYLS